jgi:hypothetical protein
VSIKIIENLLRDNNKLQINNSHQLNDITNLQSQNQTLSADNNYLTKELAKTDQELKKILTSKTWKLACKIKKFLPRKNTI